MTDRKVTNVGASVRQRLLNRARGEGRAFQELATLYAMERFLYRLGRSPHADRFVLKGGLMTLTWAPGKWSASSQFFTAFRDDTPSRRAASPAVIHSAAFQASCTSAKGIAGASG